MAMYPNYHNHQQSRDQSNQQDISSNQQRITALEKEVTDLRNLVGGLWNLLCSNSQLNEDNLRAAVAEAVASRKQVREKKRGCKTCARFVSAHYKKCIYCGGDLVGEVEESLF